jgi:CDP-paratose 2-epimerase
LYGTTKLASEHLALEYGSAFDFPVRINRCGVLAGSGQFGRADQGIFSYWIHSWRSRRKLTYTGFEGSGLQVRDCLHPRDLVPLLDRQMAEPNAATPAVVNISGGTASACSLRQLSHWCAERFGPHDVAASTTSRPFDIPWMVLDSRAADTHWGWTPQTQRDDILAEIADHAERHPNWLDMTNE